MSVSPYLFFNGNCREAMDFYAYVFGGEPMIMDASGLPAEFAASDDQKTQVMHSQLSVGDTTLMASDSIFEESPAMAGCSVQLNYPSAAEAKGYYDKLSAGGEISMPWAPTFWCAGFGVFSDKFGTRWMVGCDELPA